MAQIDKQPDTGSEQTAQPELDQVIAEARAQGFDYPQFGPEIFESFTKSPTGYETKYPLEEFGNRFGRTDYGQTPRLRQYTENFGYIQAPVGDTQLINTYQLNLDAVNRYLASERRLPSDPAAIFSAYSRIISPTFFDFNIAPLSNLDEKNTKE
jgi:hypothetical protein